MRKESTDQFPKICLATPLRTEAAKARLKLGEARLITSSDGDVRLEAILDKDGFVVLDYDY